MDVESAVSKIVSRIQSVCETLDIAENGDDIQFVLTSGMQGRIVKPLELRSRELFLAVMEDVRQNLMSLDFAAIRTVVSEGGTAADDVINWLQTLGARLGAFLDYYRPLVSRIEILSAALDARKRLFDELIADHGTGDGADFDRLCDAWREFITSNVALAEDVYRPDFDNVSAVLPEMDDSPMMWPEPDEEELSARLPSEAERLRPGLPWETERTDVSKLLPRDCDYDPILAKDWIERLWGYSRRLVSPLRSNKQLVQMPRFVMYPFYDCFFELINGLQCATANLRKGKVCVLPASAVIRNPVDGFHLPWFMEKLLIFAPREYFVTDVCNHGMYLAFASALLQRTLTALGAAPAAFDTRDIAREVPTIIDHFDRFRRALNDKPACTRREYEQTAKGIVAPFREHFLSLSAALFALEGEMTKKKKRPKENVSVRRDLNEIKDGITELTATATDINKFVHAKLGKTIKSKRTRNPARSKYCHELWLRNKENELVLPEHAEPGTQITYKMVFDYFEEGLKAKGIENADMFEKAVKSGAKQSK